MKTIKMVGSQVSVTSLMDIHVVSPDRDFTINFVYENPWVGITSSFQFVSCLSSTGIQCKTSYSALQKHSDSSFALPELYDHFFSFNRHVNAYPGLRIKKMTTEHVCLHFKVHVMRVHYPILFSCVLSTLHCFVWQLRKYKGSEKIRLKAEVIYHKFKGFFLAGDGELNSSVCRPKVKKIQLKILTLSLYFPLWLHWKSAISISFEYT